MAFLSDTFTESVDTALASHVGETGATWTKHGNSGAGLMSDLQAIDRCRVTTTGGTVFYYASGSPASADYDVEGVVFVASKVAATIGVAGRIDTSAQTMYSAVYDNATVKWLLRKEVSGTLTELGNFAQTLSVSTSYTLTLRMVGTSIKVLIDGVEQISVTDSAITAAGKAGVRGVTASTNSTGYHLDSITATDAGGPANLVLGASNGVASATLALAAPTQIPLGASSGVAAPTLALTAPTQVPLAASSGVGSATMALSAPTQVPLGASSGVAAPTLALTAPALLSLTSSGVATATLDLKALTQIPLGASSGVASPTLALSAPASVLLGSSSGTGSATLLVSAKTLLALGASSGVGSATLAVATPARIVLSPSSGVATATIILSILDLRVLIVLNPRVYPPGTVVNSYDYDEVEPWVEGKRVPPSTHVIDTAVVADDWTVTIRGVPGLNVLWATLYPKQPVWQEPIPEQQYVSFCI